MNPIWSNIFRQKPEQDSLAYFLGTIPAFSELKGRELKFLETIVHVRRYSGGETVFADGDVGSGMYAIRSGRVRIAHHYPDGREEELAILQPGDFFGESTLVTPANRSATATTLESCELVGLFRADLLETVQQHPVIASKILLGLTRVLSERVQTAAQEIFRLKNAEASAPPLPAAEQFDE